jgi:Asp/Glu/hydantoin racemase
MPKTLFLIHTGRVVIPAFDDLCRELLPSVRVFHMLDESLIKNTIAAGRLERTTIRRIIGYVQSAREGGADAVLLTCSSVGAAVEVARRLHDFPVLRVDEPMAEEAVHAGKRIGVLATLRTTLEPTTELVEATARTLGYERTIVPALCEGAYEAVTAGDTVRHDQLLSASLLALLPKVDVLVLAQASMARVVEQLPKTAITAPILTSPRSGVERARDVLLRLGAAD